MTKVTSKIQKKTFIGLVIRKLANTGHKDLTSRITAKSDNLDVEYKTAQRYARDYIYVNSGEQAKLLTELEELVKQQAADTITESESEAPAPTTSPHVDTGVEELDPDEDLAYLDEKMKLYFADEVWMVNWIRGIDNNEMIGTVKEAKEFISIIDRYTDKLQTMMVKHTKAHLKDLLHQVKECETVLDRSEIEDIWLEVCTEGGELIITPFSAETTTQVVEQLSQVVPVVEPSNTVAV